MPIDLSFVSEALGLLGSLRLRKRRELCVCVCVCVFGGGGGGGGGGLVYAVRVFQCLLLQYLQLQSSFQSSWEKALKTRFKNLRCQPRADHTGLEFTPPPSKKKRISLFNHECPTSVQPMTLDDHTYASSKTVRNNEAIISLLRETAPNRRRWIVEERPQVSTVLQKFTALQMYDMVSH